MEVKSNDYEIAREAGHCRACPYSLLCLTNNGDPKRMRTHVASLEYLAIRVSPPRGKSWDAVGQEILGRVESSMPCCDA